jgi:hypothetical protein
MEYSCLRKTPWTGLGRNDCLRRSSRRISSLLLLRVRLSKRRYPQSALRLLCTLDTWCSPLPPRDHDTSWSCDRFSAGDGTGGSDKCGGIPRFCLWSRAAAKARYLFALAARSSSSFKRISKRGTRSISKQAPRSTVPQRAPGAPQVLRLCWAVRYSASLIPTTRSTIAMCSSMRSWTATPGASSSTSRASCAAVRRQIET